MLAFANISDCKLLVTIEEVRRKQIPPVYCKMVVLFSSLITNTSDQFS